LSARSSLPSSFSTSTSRAVQAFDLVHCDLWTSPVLSLSGYKYYLVILDDYSHFLWTFPLRLKSDTFTTLTHFFAWVSTQFWRPVRALQCDNGREFDNNASRSFFLTHGVQLRLSCPYTSAQNGWAERMIHTTTNMIRCLLFQASLPATYWAEALHTATHLLNRLSSKAVSHPTPHFALYDTTPSYDHLRVFGCACYPNTSATAPNKLSPCSTRCLFLGYSPDHKGYRCLDLTSHRIISRHVVFDEDVFPLAGSTAPIDLDSLLESDPVPPHPRRPALRRYLYLVRPQRHRSCPFLRHPVDHACVTRGPDDPAGTTRGPVDHACATRGPVDHACATRGPVAPACATRGPVDPACATRGPVDTACATRSPVDPGSLCRPRARLPPSRPRRYLGACRLGPVDERGPLCRPRRRLSPPRAGHTHRSRRSGGPLRAASIPPGLHPPRPWARPPDGDSARRWRSSPRRSADPGS
jgi:hypothetical protein